MELMNKLWAAAKADKRRIVLPEGDDKSYREDSWARIS